MFPWFPHRRNLILMIWRARRKAAVYSKSPTCCKSFSGSKGDKMGPGALFRVTVQGNRLGARTCFPKALCVLCVSTLVCVCAAAGGTSSHFSPSPQQRMQCPSAGQAPFAWGKSLSHCLHESEEHKHAISLPLKPAAFPSPVIQQ